MARTNPLTLNTVAEALGAGPDFLSPMDEDELAAWRGRR